MPLCSWSLACEIWNQGCFALCFSQETPKSSERCKTLEEGTTNMQKRTTISQEGTRTPGFFLAKFGAIHKTLTAKGVHRVDQAQQRLTTGIKRPSIEEASSWVKTCRHVPMYVKPGQRPRTRILFATEGFGSYKIKKHVPTEVDPAIVEPLEGQEGYLVRRVRAQDLIRFLLTACGAGIEPG